mgnify:CR=1 FL=1
MARELEPAELLEELRGFDLVVLFDDELAPSLARPDEEGLEGELARSLIGVAFSREGGRAICWSAHEDKLLVEDVKSEVMSLLLKAICSEDFQRLLEDELELELRMPTDERRALTLERVLVMLGGEEP